MSHGLTVITPTTGKQSLLDLIASIDNQSLPGVVYHILIWDDKRDSDIDPASLNSSTRFSLVMPPGSGRNGDAPGSILRSVGLLAANTPWVMFADDDVRWELNYLETLNNTLTQTDNWAYSKRQIWSPDGRYLGIDNFESVGAEPTCRVPYEMCDGNTIVFRREFGVVAAQMFRNTTEYNDDRLMYQFLKSAAGAPRQVNAVTINHTCPEKLVDFFTENCSIRTIEFYNEYHLGDSVFHLVFLRKLSANTTDNFIYYVKDSYIAELQNHIVGYEDRISLRPLSQRTPSSINAWIGELYFTHSKSWQYDTFYVDWFNYLTTKIYGKAMDIDLISDYPMYSRVTPHYDILIINSIPQSNQFALNAEQFDDYVVKLSRNYSVITTRKVVGVPCTTDTNMTLVDIGTVAANSTNVIAIHTGPITACINKWAVERVESWIICDVRNTFSFANAKLVNTMSELALAIQWKFATTLFT